MLRIRKDQLEEIEAHMEETYPDECCGLIIGTSKDGTRTAHGSRRCRNLNEERSADRYQLDPRDMLAVERELENEPLDIIGIYHSHPDHPSRPSQFDADHAWPGWSYMIGAVERGKARSVQSWELQDPDGSERRFEEEPIEIEE